MQEKVAMFFFFFAVSPITWKEKIDKILSGNTSNLLQGSDGEVTANFEKVAETTTTQMFLWLASFFFVRYVMSDELAETNPLE